MAKVSRAEATPGRGRPPRLSREHLIDAVMELLARDPRAVPTMARIGEEVGATPAALYRHFDSQDELFDGVLARILAANEFGFDVDRPWEDQLAAWMRGLRDHLLRYPVVFSLIGRSERTSPAWLDASSALVEILEHAGLEGRALTGAYLWVLETTVGLVWQETILSLPEQIARARASAHALGDVARARFAPIQPHLASFERDDLFEFAIEQAIASLVRRRP